MSWHVQNCDLISSLFFMFKQYHELINSRLLFYQTVGSSPNRVVLFTLQKILIFSRLLIVKMGVVATYSEHSFRMLTLINTHTHTYIYIYIYISSELVSQTFRWKVSHYRSLVVRALAVFSRDRGFERHRGCSIFHFIKFQLFHGQ